MDLIRQRRNLILFTTDQQQEFRWFPEGWEQANLPGLTRLRNRGVSFRRAYTNTAMCTPSRTTMFTGLYPAQHRSTDTLSEGMSQSEGEHQLDPTIPNLGTILREAGYDVVWKGKWHLSKGVDQPDGGHVDDDISRYGMEEWNSPDAGGNAELKNYGGGSTDHDGRFFNGSTWQPPTGDPTDPDYIFTQADGPANPSWERDSVMAFLRHRIENPGGNPFCLVVCLINPHDVLGCPGLSEALGGNGTYLEGGYFGRPDGTSPWSEQTGPLAIEVPPTADEDLLRNHKPQCQARFLVASAGLGPVPTDALKLRYLNFYGNLIKLNDRYLVRMLDLLDGVDGSVDAARARTLRDQSWIVFTSDHGDMAMAHGGLRQKSFMCYEEMANVPLVWSNPVVFPEGRVCHELVSHVDLMPTICGVLGIDPAPYPFKGVDYSRLIEFPDGPQVQDSVLFTFDDIWSGQEAAGSPDGIVPPPNRLRALIEKDYKYVYYFDGLGSAAPEAEFYDLRGSGGGGTDTDPASGKALERVNYSEWAMQQQPGQHPPAAIVAQRQRIIGELEATLDTKLTPLPPRDATPPEDFTARLYRWTDGDGAVQSAVQLTWISRSNTQYQLQVSADLQRWENSGPPIPGNNGPMWLNQTVAGEAFFRLNWEPLPENPIPEPTTVVGGAAP